MILPPADVVLMIAPLSKLTVRVGCHITYEVSVPTPVLLMIRPRTDENLVLLETFSFASGLPSYEYQDANGNYACRSMLKPGRNEIRHDAIMEVSTLPDRKSVGEAAVPVHQIPSSLLRYTLPSRYCDSDKLLNIAWQQFGRVNHGYERVEAICDWVHRNIEYRFGAGRPDTSASEVISQGYGVCRDFAHVVVALCRAFNLPARYVTGYLPDIGFATSGSPEDFHAYCEVYLGEKWFTFDARFNVPRTGRIKISHGLDAVDCAFSTIYGHAALSYFEVWAYQVNPKQVTVGSPIDLSRRLDGVKSIRLG